MTDNKVNGDGVVTNGSFANGVAEIAMRRRPVVVAGCSGGTVDRRRGLLDLSKLPEIDVITGDWMSEADMTVNGAKRQQLKAESNNRSHGLGDARQAYHPNFISKIIPALPFLAANKTKVVSNAGGSNAHGLAKALRRVIAEQELDLKVAWIEGDDVTEAVLEAFTQDRAPFVNMTTGRSMKEWPFSPVSAQCYLGAFGIARALEDSDIVICGRVADSSPCMGAAIWWHGWKGTHIDELARSLVAGHLIECSSYSTGGCFAGFKKWHGTAVDLGYPIAYIDHNGSVEITMEPGKDGEVSVGTLTSQLVYEIQGPLYFNSSVVACLENMSLEQVAVNRVRVQGVTGLPPPSTTKVGITAIGGYRAEYHVFLTGLDIEEKVAMTRAQILASMGADNRAKFTCLDFQVVGRPDPEASSQDAATVCLRIFAQTSDADLLSPENFLTWCKCNILQSCPGLTPSTDARQGTGKLYYEYFATTLSQDLVHERVHLSDDTVVEIPHPQETQEYPQQQDSYETESPLPPDKWGPTTRVPLGRVALGRSGDKSTDANVGFFVREDDEWDWLRSTLTVAHLRQLLGKDDSGKRIDRFEIKGLRVVHFLLKDHLVGGYNAGAGLDCLGKNLVEYLRAKPVDIPQRFLTRIPI